MTDLAALVALRVRDEPGWPKGKPALAAVPDGWAKIDGEWVELGQGYEDALHERPIYYREAR